MASNLKALLERSTSLSAERARSIIVADVAENSHRYTQPSRSSEFMESEHSFGETLDEPPVPETVMSIAVKSALLIEEVRHKQRLPR